MNLEATLIEEIPNRRKLIDVYLSNYKHFLSLDPPEYSKASEMLWGVINNLVWTLGKLLNDEDIRSHKRIRTFLNDLFTVRGLDMGFNITSAEELHRNFFHNHVPPDDFENYRVKVEEMIEKLKGIVVDELSKRNFPSL